MIGEKSADKVELYVPILKSLAHYVFVHASFHFITFKALSGLSPVPEIIGTLCGSHQIKGPVTFMPKNKNCITTKLYETLRRRRENKG